jgi:hypothetical protein
MMAHVQVQQALSLKLNSVPTLFNINVITPKLQSSYQGCMQYWEI